MAVGERPPSMVPLRVALELVETSQRLRGQLQASCDAARLTRTKSQMLRADRHTWCAVCLGPITAADPGQSLIFVPSGDALVHETAVTHYRCFTAWIVSRVRPSFGDALEA